MSEVKSTHVRPRCKDCGLKIRGANHKEGSDHLNKAGRK